MLWQIRGTDAVTDQPVELLLHEVDAPRAIQTAMARGIVVSHIHIHRDARYKWLLLFGLCVVLGGVVTWTYVRNGDLQRKLDQALVEQNRMAESVTAAEQTIETLRTNGNLDKMAATKAAQLAGELAQARSRMSLSEQELAASQRRMNDLEKAAKMAGELDIEVRTARLRLEAATTEMTRLRTEIAMQSRRIEELQKPLPDPNLERVAELQKANTTLAEKSKAQEAEIEQLKTELLALAAQIETATPVKAGAGAVQGEPGERTGVVQGESGASRAGVSTGAVVQGESGASTGAVKGESKGSEDAISGADSGGKGAGRAGGGGERRFLDVNFEKARDFVVLHTDPDSLAVKEAAAGGGTIFSGASPRHAVRLRLEHDRSKEKVIRAELEVSLASDAPKEILAENRALMVEFVQVYAADVKAPGEVPVAAAALAGADASRQMVLTGEASRVTLWHEGAGMYGMRAEGRGKDE